MARLFVPIIVATLMIVFVTAGGEKKAIKKRDGFHITSNADVFQWICQVSGNGYTFCTANAATSTKTTPTTTTTTTDRDQPDRVTPSTTQPSTTTESSSTEQPSTTSVDSSASSSMPSALELAHWCQYAANGSWLPFNYTFIHLPCVMCHCAANHDITCNEFQCMDLHCIDGTVPRNITGQCCPQCAYETVSTSCRMNGLTFPQGARVTTVESDVECWCQSGSIECRKIPTSPTTTASTVKPTPAVIVYTSDSYLPSGMTAYVVVIVICLVLMLGTLLCCGCALAYYYYYQNQQQNMQQAYEQYYNNAGWQPMGADGVTAEDKQAEAAQQADAAAVYPPGQSPQYIPPPYAVFNGPYEPKPQGQQQV
jgi:hypothetical protein